MGQQVSQLGEVMFDRETTAAATERDNYLSDQIRELIYNPENGFSALQGKAAVDARGRTLEALEALKSNAVQGLNGTAKRKLESSMNRRISGAMDTVERHTLSQRDAWLVGASNARMVAAHQDALINPSETAAALSVIESEVRATAMREGWGNDKLNVELAAQRSGVYRDQITRIAVADPIKAMEYLRANEGKMVPSDVVNLEAKLTPEVKKAVGRARGKEIYGGGDVSTPGTAPLQRLVDKTEGGAAYDTLYGFSQREKFAGVDVSSMTIGELKSFSSPNGAYAQWVKGKVGRVATPMGRYQIVGSTLKQAAAEMGLPDDTVFNEQTQDAMFAHLARKRLSGPRTPEGKREALRAEWDGFKHVSDGELDAAIASFERGGIAAPAGKSGRTGSVVSSLDGSESPAHFRNMKPDIQDKFLNISAQFGQPLRITPHGGKSARASATSQHGHGTAMDVYVADMTADERAKLIAVAIANGATGIGGYAAGDGKGTIHIDFRSSPGKGPGGLALWWRNKPGVDDSWSTGESWFQQGVRSGLAAREGGEVPEGMMLAPAPRKPADVAAARRQALAIEDPVERDAALTYIEQQHATDVGEWKAQREQAQEKAFSHIEAGHLVDDLPLETRQSLGIEAMNSLRVYQNKLTASEPITTDDTEYYRLRKMAVEDPERFRNENLIQYRHIMDDGDFETLIDLQTKPADKKTAPSPTAASTMMTIAGRHLKAAGIDDTPEEGTDDAERVASVQGRLLRWQDTFMAEHGRAPTQTEIDEQVGRELMPFVINPPWALNEVEGRFFEAGDLDMNMTPASLADSGITIGGVEVPPDVLAEQIRSMQDAGIPVTAENLISHLRDLFEGADIF